MTCISVSHYIVRSNKHDLSATPAVFIKSQHYIDTFLKYVVGGWYIYKKTKHFASMNIISVSDPYVIDEANSLPIKCLTLPDVKKCEDLANAHERGVVWDHIPDYERLIQHAYPNLDFIMDERKGVLCFRIWAIDIECVDYSSQKLLFINEADALSAVKLFRSAM
ncbi:hypothetical protein RCIP0012_00077 [Klebsiella phage RCIP0012]